jgi:hypothetical protein
VAESVQREEAGVELASSSAREGQSVVLEEYAPEWSRQKPCIREMELMLMKRAPD